MAGLRVNRDGRIPVSSTYQPGDRDERPWGVWEIIASGPRYAVKRIVVRPGQRLSLQRHAFRAEHWVVVGGTARVTRGAETLEVLSGESVMIGRGEVHRIENRGLDELVFIEVQHGEYLAEDDIERIEDDYGRR
jgi:mannose-1-phosphate guanylyltransferase/mannose-6-phosphate isomerase